MATILGLLWVVGIKAQQPKNDSTTRLMTTNWIGYLAFGKDDTLDRIARGPFPMADREVEIGLRSDGVMVWRRTQK